MIFSWGQNISFVRYYCYYYYYYYYYLRYLMFLVTAQTSNSLMSSRTWLHIRSYTFNYLFRILWSIKIIFGLIFDQYMTNISTLFSALWENSAHPQAFYDFDKIAIQCNLLNLRCLLLFSCHSTLHEKSKKQTHDNWFLITYEVIKLTGT